jgi:hypothetical protein
MTFYYKAYNISVISTIPLPSLTAIKKEELGGVEPIRITIGNVPKKLRDKANVEVNFHSINEQELLFSLPEVARYYIKDGNRIIIEPLGENESEIHLNVYTNCLAAILYQRNILPFHVSGVLVGDKALLIAAPSGTGKSTTAIKLQELGYSIFTDDTAIIEFQNGICYATASYPMTRLWQSTIDLQNIFDDSQKKQIYAEVNKYAFDLHDQFILKKTPILAIVFMETAGDEIRVEAIPQTQCFEFLLKNTYRNQWIVGMNKQRLQFSHIISISNNITAYRAKRPPNLSTEDIFATTIVSEIIEKLNYL